MISLRQRAALADASLAAGATILLLYSTATSRAWWSLAAGIAFAVAGMVALWGTPQPTLRARLLASVAGLLIAFGASTLALGASGWIAIIAGVALLLGVLRATAIGRPNRRQRRQAGP